MRYAIVIEQAQGNYSAYVPDLPGCVATGSTVEDVERDIREAIELHLCGLRYPHALQMGSAIRTLAIVTRNLRDVARGTRKS